MEKGKTIWIDNDTYKLLEKLTEKKHKEIGVRLPFNDIIKILLRDGGDKK